MSRVVRRLAVVAALALAWALAPAPASADDKPKGETPSEKIRKALEVLHDQSGGRAERIQQIFSLEYDSTWEKPKPRY